MVSMIALFLILLILLLVGHGLSYRKIILTPQFGFVAGFLLSVGYGMTWVDEWNLQLSADTFLVLVTGTALFVVTSVLMQWFGIKFRFSLGKKKTVKMSGNIASNENDSEIIVEQWKLILFIILQLIILLATLYYLIYQVGGGLAGAIYAINSSSKTEEESIGFPFILRQMRNMSFASGFFWSYILTHSMVYKYRCHRILLVINIGLSVLIYLLGGARQGAVQLVISLIVMTYFMWGESNQWRKTIRTKTVFKICILALVLILSYQTIGNAFGRNFNIDSNDYIAAYLSAEIKNLDTFIREGVFYKGNSFSTTQTFAHIANQLAGRFGLPERSFKFDQPYRYVNGHYLGNVYTVFWAFLYDGGYPALIYLTVLMATILQVVYLKVVKNKHGSRIKIMLIIYSYMYFECVFSFFTCWFYARTFNTSFIYYCFYWMCFKIYIEKVKTKQYKTRHVRQQIIA